jgi:vancomycin resistance protein YoaR
MMVKTMIVKATGLIKQNLNIFLISSIYALVLLVAGYHFYYAKKIIPGVRVGSVNLGGLTSDEAFDRLIAQELSTTKQLSLTYQDQSFIFDGESMGLEYMPAATVVRAFEVGRTGNILIDTKDKLAGILKPLRLGMHYELPLENISAYLATVTAEINLSPKNAYYTYEDDSLDIVPEEMGLQVVDQSLYDAFINSVKEMDFTTKEIKVDDVYPDLTKEDLQANQEKVSELISQSIVISYENKTWAPAPSEMLNFIEINKSGKNKKTEVAFAESAFESYAQIIAFDVNKLPRGLVTETSNNKVVGFEFTSEGLEVDAKKLIDDFEDALFNNKSRVEIVVNKVDSFQDPAKYGIFALLGEGTSKYTGSAAGRIQNLTLAAQRTSGVLVPPGGIYSFNNSVGPISGATGYATAYIISGGRTILGDGGGVCQTSTTLFRAVLNSGLPIVTRHPHAYRVSYYEIDSQVGFDAAIYQPSLDFQFKNDTPGYVLVQYFTNPEEDLLGFRLYGTPDGRQVEISDAVVTGQSPPPEALYQDDPSLAKGVVRQIDFAAWGATASFNRKVTRGDEVLYDSTFTTRYQPWRAVFLVGTKEEKQD